MSSFFIHFILKEYLSAILCIHAKKGIPTAAVTADENAKA
jgi:hypothetical protein